MFFQSPHSQKDVAKQPIGQEQKVRIILRLMAAIMVVIGLVLLTAAIPTTFGMLTTTMVPSTTALSAGRTTVFAPAFL